MKRRPWRPQLTRAEMGRGWVFFALYLTVFPLCHGWVQRAFHGELPVAEANVVYYLLAATLVFLVFWTFLRHGFDLLLDWLPETCSPSAPRLVGAGCSICWSCSFLCRYRIPTGELRPAVCPLPGGHGGDSGGAMPLVEEPLFRGLLRRHPAVQLGAGHVLSTLVFALYCVWQFVYSTARWISATCCCSPVCPCPWP
ncbi:MAG: CPBP family intramembrane glutamate endopeptidase [Evtepia sp.]